MGEIDSKTLDLIAKLHALATNKGATEAEAANALARMQELLFRHNLTLDDVSFTKDERKDTFSNDLRQVGDVTAGAFGKRRFVSKPERQWVCLLASDIARYNFCSTAIATDFSFVRFVGTPENIQAVKSIWEYAIEQVADLAEQSYRENYGSAERALLKNPDADRIRFKKNFGNGCEMRLRERLREGWESLQKKTDSTALVVVNEKALDEYREQFIDAKLRFTYGKELEGIQHGYKAGDKVRLTSRPDEITGGQR